jgi:hypothetical protein
MTPDGIAPGKNFFIIFVDAIFTVLIEPPFTSISIETRKKRGLLACGADATPINSAAT